MLSPKHKIRSKAAKFEMADKSLMHMAINQVMMQDDFMDASRAEKIIMKAWSLKDHGLKYEANNKFKTYVESDKDNMLLRNVQDAFRKEVKISCLCKE